ncbi:MAG TPA: pyruvate, phosphate dikinase [Acidobacteriota bacterium]
MTQQVYFFGAGKADGDGSQKSLLGGKGAGLAEMTRLGVPVPAGFTITTDVCMEYLRGGNRYPAGLERAVDRALTQVEQVMGKRFGDPAAPLLVSVRSGGRASMPGMMDTVLNIGLNQDTVSGLAKLADDERFALDCYRRLIQMYGEVVLGVPKEAFDEPLEAIKRERGRRVDTELTASDWSNVVERFLDATQRHSGKRFPQDPRQQLWGAIGAVFNSWYTPRAITYRRLNRLPDDWGTAVNVVAMVFGNLGSTSATGVVFTRDPGSGERKLFGDFLVNAQGEDVVAGIRNTQPIEQLAEVLPAAYRELEQVCHKLEQHYRDVQDIEFTVENEKLWVLQTRAAKRGALAAIRLAVDMVDEKLIDHKTAVLRVNPHQLGQLLHPILDPKAEIQELARGLGVSAGAASGEVVFTADAAVAARAAGRKVILVRHETSPDDIHGMDASQAFLTARGGSTSHAAIVARAMGKCCVAGCEVLEIDERAGVFRAGTHTVRAGEVITLDGSSGRVLLGAVPTLDSEIARVVRGELPAEKAPVYQLYHRLLGWADQARRLKVRANGDTPQDMRMAVAFGAEGVGLCRTEHMFFQEGRIERFRAMILADSQEERRRAADQIEPFQREDFAAIFRVMGARPVTIRTLDPPLHEFLPHGDEEIAELARSSGVSEARIRARSELLREANPMLGHRGCRLGITYPEITAMQARAIFRAACEVAAEGIEVQPEVMIPLVTHVNELKLQAELVRNIAEEVFRETGRQVPYTVGTMIETPRAALTAKEIASAAEFFSFGTNDLTQTTFGLSRDDGGGFLPHYIEQKIYPWDPFATIDPIGVGRLVELAVAEGRESNPKLKIGICGEHGGDPDSVVFCHRAGLDYVSCSPYRVPVARLAAAHGALSGG